MVVRRTPWEKEHACPLDYYGGKCVYINMLTNATCYAYILKSLYDGKYYYGSCKDLEKRLLDHNAGKVKATKFRRPFELHYFEKLETRSGAYKREMFFKSIEGYRWLKEQQIT